MPEGVKQFPNVSTAPLVCTSSKTFRCSLDHLARVANEASSGQPSPSFVDGRGRWRGFSRRSWRRYYLGRLCRRRNYRCPPINKSYPTVDHLEPELNRDAVRAGEIS
jgi:hypothetical protein